MATEGEMVLTHLRDHCRASCRSRLVDIRRIAADGPQYDDDTLVRMVFCYVAGDLLEGRDG